MPEIFVSPPHPFYIVTPSYVQASAGIRCLHILCHTLNKRGCAAYIVQEPDSHALGAQFVGGPDLLTPILSRQILDTHSRRGHIPIVVYPEIVKGNPYKSEVVVRYILNFPGLLGGDHGYPANELCFGYSAALAEAAGTGNILFIPPIDTATFYPPPVGSPRKGTCFYADKFRKVHGGTPFSLTDDSVEITREQEGEQSPQEIAELFRTSELFYSYENTALAIEAVLCGCPAVFIPNPHLTELISSKEVGTDGYAWGTDDAEIARAKATVARGAANYLASIDMFWTQLDDFIEKTQRKAAATTTREAKVDTDQSGSRVFDLFKYLDGLIQTERQVELYPSLRFAAIACVLRLLPPIVEREVSKLFSTLGFTRIGGYLWNSSFYRNHPKIMVTVSDETMSKAAGATLYPPVV